MPGAFLQGCLQVLNSFLQPLSDFIVLEVLRFLEVGEVNSQQVVVLIEFLQQVSLLLSALLAILVSMLDLNFLFKILEAA